MKATRALLLCLLPAACSSPEGGPASDAATVFQGARLIPGDGSAPLEDAVFVVEGGRFTAVGRRGEVAIPAGAARVDLAGRTVMPALVNAHMHLPSSHDERVVEARRNAHFGASAVTSLGLDSGDVALRIREESLPGAARTLTAGRGITRPEPGRSQVPYWIDTPEEARQAVREQAERGVDLIKVWVDDRDGRYAKLTPELYGAAIDEAHRHGLRVAAHLFTLEDAKGLLDAGVDAFAHGVRDRDVDDTFVAALTARPDVFYVPNLPDPGVARDLGWLAGSVPEDELRALQEAAVDRPQARDAFAIQARNLARLDGAGARIAFGTDGGSPWAAHLEMEDMVAAGMSPADVLVAATSTSAELLKLDQELGTIAPGRSADFLVLEANPLDDITNTRRIDAVYLRGVAVERERTVAP